MPGGAVRFNCSNLLSCLLFNTEILGLIYADSDRFSEQFLCVDQGCLSPMAEADERTLLLLISSRTLGANGGYLFGYFAFNTHDALSG